MSLPTPHLRILMATWNGAEYLSEQLRSFQSQTHPDWSLWVSDDGSTDATRDILETFRRENPDRDIRILDGPRKGAARNFLSLLAPSPVSEGTLIALSDQDDVWLPDKLARAATALSALPPGPDAYSAAHVVTEADLTPRRQSHKRAAGPSFGNALVQNILSGHSMVLNSEAQRLLAQADPAIEVPFHDWWAYLVITGAGGQIVYDPEPAVLYRQHGQNTLGSNATTMGLYQRAILIRQGQFRRWIDANLAALEPHQELLTEANRATFAAFQALRRAGSIPPGALHRLGIHRQSRTGTVALAAAGLMRRL